MTHPSFIQARINQIKKRNAWQAVIEAAQPHVLVTLGTNRGMPEREFRRYIGRALFDLDRTRLNGARSVHWRSALNRVCAFIAPEKLDTNAHAHLFIYSPTRLLYPQSLLVRQVEESRVQRDFIGLGRDTYDPNVFQSATGDPPELERIWRELVPGGHYHARRTDDRVSDGIDYVLKELPWNFDRDVWLSQDFWSDDQLHMELTLPLSPNLIAPKIDNGPINAVTGTGGASASNV